MQLLHFTLQEQKWIIGVVLIVPIYAVESVSMNLSWFCLHLMPILKLNQFLLHLQYVSFCSTHAALVFEIVRLYSFGRYLVACLGTNETDSLMIEQLYFT